MRIAGYGFRRHSAYRAAAVAGAFTNTVFGILRAYVLIAPATPASWAFFAASFALGVIVSFGWRYLMALSACWIIDDRGVQCWPGPG